MLRTLTSTAVNTPLSLLTRPRCRIAHLTPHNMCSPPTRGVWSHLSGSLNAASVDFDQIPIVDISSLNQLPSSSSLLSSSSSSRLSPALQQTIDSLHIACRDVGFFYIRNHPLSSSYLSQTFSHVQAFFNADQAVKDSISCVGTPNRGYFRIGEENLGEKQRGDDKEGIDIGVECEDEPANTSPIENTSKIISDFKKKNKWPDARVLPGFREAMENYFAQMLSLGHLLTRASLRILHYPPQHPSTVSDEHLGAGSHTDYGVMTIVAETSGGLEVRNRSGVWISLPHLPDCLIVNLGDMTQRWTNGFYQSTPHRVINTKSGLHRYSIPFFFEPNIDCVVRVHERFITPERPARYEPIQFAQHLHNMYMHTYKKQQAQQQPTIAENNSNARLQMQQSQ